MGDDRTPGARGSPADPASPPMAQPGQGDHLFPWRGLDRRVALDPRRHLPRPMRGSRHGGPFGGLSPGAGTPRPGPHRGWASGAGPCLGHACGGGETHVGNPVWRFRGRGNYPGGRTPGRSSHAPSDCRCLQPLWRLWRVEQRVAAPKGIAACGTRSCLCAAHVDACQCSRREQSLRDSSAGVSIPRAGLSPRSIRRPAPGRHPGVGGCLSELSPTARIGGRGGRDPWLPA